MNKFLPHDTLYMQRCLELAKNGLGLTYPNPMVGSVIVHNQKIIGEGWHQKAGEPHAEVNAINSVENKELLKKSCLYVNLEPCSHFGKTPPCSDLIIRMQIPRVVIAAVDTNSLVAGKGIERMRNAGIEVIVGVLQQEARLLNRRFYTFHEKKRPYIVLKWAQTLDNYIDIIRQKDAPLQPYWITNSVSRTIVHKWRAEEASILVGTRTIEMDNPKLNVREWSGNEPLRLVIDQKLRLRKNSSVFDQSQPTICFTELDSESIDNLEFVNIDFNGTEPEQIMQLLYKRNIQSVFVEGGTKLINSLFHKNLWDEARIFTGNKFFHSGVKAPDIKGTRISTDNFDDSNLFVLYNLYNE